MRVTYRQIAKVLVRGLPLNNNEVASKVEEYIRVIEAMPEKARLALQSAYIFASKVPPDEREDMFLELFGQVLKAFNHQKIKTQIARVNETFAYKVARCDWLTWYRDCKRHQPHWAGSLNEVTTDEDGHEVELIDTMVGEAHFEDETVAKLDAQRIWDSLPDTIKPIIKKRLRGETLTNAEKCKLHRYRKLLKVASYE